LFPIDKACAGDKDFMFTQRLNQVPKQEQGIIEPRFYTFDNLCSSYTNTSQIPLQKNSSQICYTIKKKPNSFLKKLYNKYTCQFINKTSDSSIQLGKNSFQK
jgi:hypothetical protein